MPEIKTTKATTSTATILFAVCIALVLVNILFIYFTLNEVNTLSLLKQELGILEQDEKIIKSAADIYNKYQQQTNIISNVFPDEESMLVFIQDMESVIRPQADEYSFKFNSVTPNREQDFLYLPLTINIKTQIPKLVILLHNLEKMNYMTHLVSFSSKSPDGISGQSEIVLVYKIYVKNPFSTK